MARPPQKNLIDGLFAKARSEAQKRAKADTHHQKAAHLRTLLMGCQARLEADRSRYKSVRSPRQTGKSTGVMLITLIRCLEKAGAEWVVIGLTRPSIKRIYWGALKALNQAFELGLEFQHQELTATLPNGSKIYFVGADNIGEIEKLRGGRYDGAVVDECKSFEPSVFEALIHDVLEAALMAKNGELTIVGTPGDVLEGPFYLATCTPPVVMTAANGERRLSNAPVGTLPEYPALWVLHQWTMRDNTTAFETGKGGTYTMWDQALEVKRKNGWADDHPTWRREYLGHWVADNRRTVFRYRTYLHDYVPAEDTLWGLPEAVAKSELRRVVGMDLGTRDGTAIVVWAYSDSEPGMWELYSEKRTREPGERFPVSEVAAWFREVEEEYGPFHGGVVDTAGLATMVVDTLAIDHGVNLEPAEKKEKVDHIELFNNDLDAGLIHVRKGSALSQELRTARWAEKPLERNKKEEDPKVPNDITDAGVYAFRWSRHRQAKPLVPTTPLFSPQWFNERAQQDLRAAQTRAREALDPAGKLDRRWWDDTN